jgi:RND family efflux transporter MFP subunit
MTPTSGETPSTSLSGRRGWGPYLLPVLFLVAGAAGYWWLVRGGNRVADGGAHGETAAARPLEVMARKLRRQDFRVRVDSHGMIEAHNPVKLTPEVPGRVVAVHRGFERGAFFSANEVLLELDPSDFQLDLLKAEAQLAHAEFELEQVRMRSKQAKLDWQDLGYDEAPNELILLKPQLHLAERRLEVALEEIASARRNLERTKVRAPFPGRVLSREVGVGQTVGHQEPLGEVFATDHSEVRLAIPARAAVDLDLPEKSADPPLPCHFQSALAGEDPNVWEARIVRTEGALDERTLNVFAIARIDDPFGLQSGKRSLRIGEPVRARIPGRVLKDVFVIPWSALVGLDRIRTVDAESRTLGSVKVEPLWSDGEQLAFRDEAIKDGTMLVLSRLAYAPDGAQVALIAEEDAATNDILE